MPDDDVSRREMLRLAGAGATLLVPGWLAACSSSTPGAAGPTTTAVPTTGAPTTGAPSATTAGSVAPFTGYGPLLAPDGNGLSLPSGFTSRVIATTGEPVGSTGYEWPANPDGGAVFAADDGGWIYVANAETGGDQGGVSMVRFSATGDIVAARAICTGTNANCAGGATPWNTWLTCEEIPDGHVWECDPTGAKPAELRAALGTFKHEAVAVVPSAKALFLTEDEIDGVLYRFTPTNYPDLSSGTLSVLVERGGALSWTDLPDPSGPNGTAGPTRNQVPDVKRFGGGEGICEHQGSVFFTTKYDGRVWRYDPAAHALSVVYDPPTSGAVLNGVDNITVRPSGDLYVAEDGDNMQIVLVGAGLVEAVVQVMDVAGSEVTGPAFTADGRRLYFSSQRTPGRTYEVSGPWR